MIGEREREAELKEDGYTCIHVHCMYFRHMWGWETWDFPPPKLQFPPKKFSG